MVEEGRRLVQKEVANTEHLMHSNFKVLKSNLENLANAAQTALQEQLYNTQEDHHLCIQIISLLELIEINHVQIVHDLCEVAKSLSQMNSIASTNGGDKSANNNNMSSRLFHHNLHSSSGSRRTSRSGVGTAGGGMNLATALQQRRLGFQLIGNNAADFFMMSSYLEQSAWCLATTEQDLLFFGGESGDGTSSNSSSSRSNSLKKSQRISGASTSSSRKQGGENGIAAVGVGAGSGEEGGNQYIKPIELARLYKVAISPKLAAIDAMVTCTRVYAVIGIDDLKHILTSGWSGVLKNGRPKIAQLFASDPCKSSA